MHILHYLCYIKSNEFELDLFYNNFTKSEFSSIDFLCFYMYENYFGFCFWIISFSFQDSQRQRHTQRQRTLAAATPDIRRDSWPAIRQQVPYTPSICPTSPLYTSWPSSTCMPCTTSNNISRHYCAKNENNLADFSPKFLQSFQF